MKARRMMTRAQAAHHLIPTPVLHHLLPRARTHPHQTRIQAQAALAVVLAIGARRN